MEEAGLLGKEVQVVVTFFYSRIDSPIFTGWKKWGGVRSVFHVPWSRLFHLSDVDVIWNQQAACWRWPCKMRSCVSMFLLSKEPFQPGVKSAQLSHMTNVLETERQGSSVSIPCLSTSRILSTK